MTRRSLASAVTLVFVAGVLLPSPAAAASRYNWVPRQGTAYMQNLSSGYRNLQEYFIWWSASQLSALQGSNVTLEVEAHVYCVYTCWTNGIRNPNYRGTAWQTNMPYGYLDTQFADDPNYPNLTVGSADTRGMVAGAWYYTWIQAYPGNSSTGSGSTSYQIGHRNPSWCYSTWCIYPDDTVYVIPNWVQALPSTRSWFWP